MNTSQELTPQSAETLKMRMQDLAGTMAKAAESLQKGESVELQYVADEIGNVQQLMKSLSDKLREHPLLASSEQNSNDLTSLAEACRQIEMRQQAIDKLKRLQLVKSFDENDRGAFEEMAQKVTSVIETLTNGQAEDRKRAVDLVTMSDSPYRAVYEMVNRPEELSDDRWMENQRLISETFGRNVTLAVLRGRAR
ncbi:hypothetical protein [Rubinisphaera italica]|uniref:Uncharacterized protein n=1 Tax=Rubinisphaera italica TaxID=2527969 RepID=A0A5C5XM17_9PLAN|nr:hypothetical protein [Rubinisphaera italica]TWT63599.1 hypothetical protein Pan54_43530 [Rubinisphaera italica]HBN74677.1 hypothetical protein [Planctomycetaceae bacterium]|tara:strand:+ start:347 stop:931 length:585 start_codon:yes stop_codon:yes gene_type:complete